MGALLRFYLHLDPDQLSDDEFAKEWARLQYVLKVTGVIEFK